MLRLMLLRHAKSDWTADAPSDFERPLNGRGRAAAPIVGAHMRRHGLEPDRILCSPALRTRQTLDLILPHVGAAAPLNMPPALYDDGDLDYLEVIRALGGDARCLLVVGHNPATQETALELSGRGEERLLHTIAGKYPTAGLAVIDIDIDDWRSLKRGDGHLVAVALPRHLNEASELSAIGPAD